MSDGLGAIRLSDASRGDKRGLILAEAVRLFNQQGYFDTRLEDVATRLDTAKTSISYHFKSKEVLLAEAYKATCAFALDALQQASQGETGRDQVTGWLRNLATAHARSARGAAPPLATLNDLSGLGDADRADVTATMEIIASKLAAFIANGVKDGSIVVTSVEATAFFLLNAAHWMRPWLEHVPIGEHDDAIGSLIDLFLHGLLKNSTMPQPSYPIADGLENSDFLFDRETRNRMKVEAFLRVGTRHFNRKGYTNLSLSDVAGELGVSRGSLYYYIDDKDTLLRGCVDRSLCQIERAFEHHAKRGPAGEAIFRIAAEIYQGHISDLDPQLRLPLLQALSVSERRAANARLSRIRANFDEIVAMGMADGSIRQFETEAIGEIILGAIHAATPQRLKSFGMHGASRTSSFATATAFFEPLFKGVAGQD